MIWKSVPLILICLAVAAFGDKTFSENQKANRLYDKGKYDKALKIYDDAILESPADQKLKMNKGSTLYRLNQFDKAEESFNSAQDIKDKKALADLYFNRGNVLFREGQQQMQQGGQGAQEKLKAALDNYIKTLDLRSSDRDAKWNLQLTQGLLKKAQQQQQQQNQDKNQQNKNKQNQSKQDQKNNQQNQNQKQDKSNQQQNQDQKKQQDQNNQQQPKQDQQDAKNQKQQQQPQQPDKQEQMKKEEAARLIRQFSDDANNLNKPVKVYKANEKKPEKDW